MFSSNSGAAMGGPLPGLHCGPSLISRQLSYFSHGRPFLEGTSPGYTSTTSHCRQRCKTIHGNLRQAPQNAKEPSLRQGIVVYESFLAGIIQTKRHQAPYELVVSPTVRWANRGHEPRHRAIFMSLHASETIHMGSYNTSTQGQKGEAIGHDTWKITWKNEMSS